MNLIELLESSAERWGDRELLVTGVGGAEGVTYDEFLVGVGGLAELLDGLGVRPGARVATVLGNVPELLYSWFAAARLGAVLVPVNPALVPIEAEALLRDAGVEAMIGEAAELAAYGERMSLPIKVLVGEGAVPGAAPFGVPSRPAGARSPAPGPACSPWSSQSTSTILQTSGTTGQAKGAELTHASYVLPAQEFVRWMEVEPGERFLACLPLFHMAGQAFAAAAIAGGAALALVERFSARLFWSQVRRHRITVVRHLGEMLAVLCRQPARPNDRFHTLRAVYGGGARADVVREFERRFGVAVVEGYGLTETNTVLRNEIGSRRAGSIGRPAPYCAVRIADELGRELPASRPGAPQVGEIQVERNPVMMARYCGNGRVTEDCFVAGWFRTGDLGYRDEDGYFFWVGRLKETIRRRGENILPARVEEVLDRHPAVAGSAVIGVPDEVGGEEIKAFLVGRRGLAPAPEEVVDWCRAYLADFEIPRYFELCDELPATSTNKIHKSRLRSMGTVGGPCYDRQARSWRTLEGSSVPSAR